VFIFHEISFLNLTQHKKTGAKTGLAPLPIGFAVWIIHIVLIPWTGCGINPPRAFGSFIVNSFAGVDAWGQHWWIYFVGPALGAILAPLIYMALYSGKTKAD
jgi:glycerol uptake facilitator-like aquaporin